MARHITGALERAEEQWRRNSPEWKQKLIQWDAWKAQSKQRELAEARARKKRKGEEDENGYDRPDASWESSFDPNDPSPQFSFIGPHTSKVQLDEDIKNLSWTSIPPWTFAALRRGIGIHHAGMHKHYRTMIER